MDILFSTQSNVSPSSAISSQRCVNAYAEAQPPDAKTPVAVFGNPGISPFAAIGTGPIRGMYEMKGIAYCLSGATFWSFDSSGTPTNRGSGVSVAGTDVVSMDGNGLQIVVTNGTKGY